MKKKSKGDRDKNTSIFRQRTQQNAMDQQSYELILKKYHTRENKEKRLKQNANVAQEVEIQTCNNLVRRGSALGLEKSVNSWGEMLTIISSTRKRAKAKSKHVAQMRSCRESMNTLSGRFDAF